MDVNALQPLNTPLPIEVTEFGMSIEDRCEHPVNTAFPIEVTEFGIVTDVKFVH